MSMGRQHARVASCLHHGLVVGAGQSDGLGPELTRARCSSTLRRLGSFPRTHSPNL